MFAWPPGRGSLGGGDGGGGGRIVDIAGPTMAGYMTLAFSQSVAEILLLPHTGRNSPHAALSRCVILMLGVWARHDCCLANCVRDSVWSVQ